MNGLFASLAMSVLLNRKGGVVKAIEEAGKDWLLGSLGPFANPVEAGRDLISGVLPIDIGDQGRALLRRTVGDGDPVAAGKRLIRRTLGGGPLGSASGRALRALMSSETVRDVALTAAQRRAFARAHQEWLADNRWRFDWRSQPRRPAGTEAGGEWMEGRLDYPVQVKYHVSRRERQRRTRAIKAYKARMAGTKTRTIRTSWGEY